jgi:hypothetical protein
LSKPPTYASRLRYLDAADVDDAVVVYDGLDVYGPDSHKVGAVDGFIVDADARRVNYIVIDSGGWFTSRRLLLPIGHATLAQDRTSLQVDVTRDELRHLPEYEADRFREFTDDELRAFERDTVVACCPDEPLEDVSSTRWSYDGRRHYTQPEWWLHSRYSPARLRTIGAAARVRPASPPSTQSSPPVPPARERFDREFMTARETSEATDRRQRDDAPGTDEERG